MKPFTPAPIVKDPHFPAMKWHPETGESKVFHKADEVPEGWLDTHPSNAVAQDKPAAADAKDPVKGELSMTRAEIIKAMEDGGVEFKKNAPTAALAKQLTEAVKAALTEAQVEFQPDADVKELLELLPKPE